MRRLPFFFAYFWFSPVTGGWTNVRLLATEIYDFYNQ